LRILELVGHRRRTARLGAWQARKRTGNSAGDFSILPTAGEPWVLPYGVDVMQLVKRAISRLAKFAVMGAVSSLAFAPDWTRAAAPPERVLPDSTVFLLKVENVRALREAFQQSQYGQLWNDEGMRDLREDLASKLKEASDTLRAKIGVTLRELLELPQGTFAVAAIARDDPKLPVAVSVMADAGANAAKMTEVMNRSTKQAEQAGAKVVVETFQGMPLHIVQPPAAQDQNDELANVPRPPLVWTSSGSLFYLGSNVDVVKDLVANDKGRSSGSLATSQAFLKTQSKIVSSDSQALWYLDLGKLIKLLTRASSRGGEAQAQQIEFLIQELGLNGLKSIGGTLAMNVGNYNSMTKTFFHAPAPLQGLLKIFSLPPMNLRPEAWVPATVSSYQTLSWDLDAAYDAINDLVNKFQPGMLNVLEQQLVGPEGGEPLSFQKDLFGPLGDRITVISDFKKPITEESQRMLVGIALEDAKGFQRTLDRMIELANAAPNKREFQGTTILDFELPNLPNPNGGNLPALRGPMSVAVAKETLFLTTDTTLLEQVLRPGVVPLAESSAFELVARELPQKISGMTFARPDEQARLSYDMLKSGQFEAAIRQGMAARGGDAPEIPKLIDPEKLPDFSVFAKYLTVAGSYSVSDEDGLVSTAFTLRKTNP